MADNDRDLIKEARESLLENKGKSDEAHDKALTTLTAGTLAVSVSFISNVVHLEKATGIFLLVSAWVMLTLSLMINLVGHMLTAEYTLNDLHKLDTEPENYDAQRRRGLKFNRKIIFWNRVAVVISLVSIALIVTFCSINIYHMRNENGKERFPPQRDPGDYEKKGHPNYYPSNPPAPPQQQPAPQPQPPPPTPKK